MSSTPPTPTPTPTPDEAPPTPHTSRASRREAAGGIQAASWANDLLDLIWKLVNDESASRAWQATIQGRIENLADSPGVTGKRIDDLQTHIDTVIVPRLDALSLKLDAAATRAHPMLEHFRVKEDERLHSETRWAAAVEQLGKAANRVVDCIGNMFSQTADWAAKRPTLVALAMTHLGTAISAGLIGANIPGSLGLIARILQVLAAAPDTGAAP